MTSILVVVNLSVYPRYLHNIMHIAAVLANQEPALTSRVEIIIIKSVHKALTPEEGRPFAAHLHKETNTILINSWPYESIRVQTHYFTEKQRPKMYNG